MREILDPISAFNLYKVIIVAPVEAFKFTRSPRTCRWRNIVRVTC